MQHPHSGDDPDKGLQDIQDNKSHGLMDADSQNIYDQGRTLTTTGYMRIFKESRTDELRTHKMNSMSMFYSINNYFYIFFI